MSTTKYQELTVVQYFSRNAPSWKIIELLLVRLRPSYVIGEADRPSYRFNAELDYYIHPNSTKLYANFPKTL